MQLDQAAHYILNRLKEGLSPNLRYHDAIHTMDVYSVARQLAQHEGIEGKSLDLLLTAALFHDAGFLISPEEHEFRSCNIVRETLPGFGYSDTEIDIICGLIMATKIPQSPKQHLEEILCDADLDYLGRADFFERSQLLYEEMSSLGKVNSREEYNRMQLAFLHNHHYFTATSKRIRKPKKEENLRKLTT